MITLSSIKFTDILWTSGKNAALRTYLTEFMRKLLWDSIHGHAVLTDKALIECLIPTLAYLHHGQKQSLSTAQGQTTEAVELLLTDRSETFKANGEASFNRFSAKVHHSSFELAASFSWLWQYSVLNHMKIEHNFVTEQRNTELNKLNHAPFRAVKLQWWKHIKEVW